MNRIAVRNTDDFMEFDDIADGGEPISFFIGDDRVDIAIVEDGLSVYVVNETAPAKTSIVLYTGNTFDIKLT